MDAAYSLAYGQIIDAEKAYDLYQVRIIQNKRAFECPNENCDAQVTCANIDRTIQSKNSVHYRAYGNHSLNCSYHENNLKRKFSSSNKESNRSKDHNTYVLTKRPKDYYDKKTTTLKDKNLDKEKNVQKREYSRNKNSNSPKKYFWLAPIVTPFLNHWKTENEKKLKNKSLKINNYRTSFLDFFEEIDNQDYSSFSEYPKIYFGKAFLYKFSKGVDKVKVYYDSHIRVNDEQKRLSVNLDFQILSQYKTYEYWKEKLFKVADENLTFLFFVYGKPTLKNYTPKDKKEVTYVYFPTKNLDYMDIRLIEE